LEQQSAWTEDQISVDEARTLDGLCYERVRRSPERPAYRWHERHSDQWHELTWGEMGRAVGRWQAALAAEGLQAGDRVALQLRNCPEWVQFDQAALGLGLVVVPVYTDDRPENVAYMLRDSGAKVLLVPDAGRWKRLEPVLDDTADLRRVLLLEAGHLGHHLSKEDPRVRVVEDWLPPKGELRRREGDPDGLASLVYTSGTTGRPKGVMLSHRNLLAVAAASLAGFHCYQEDVFLSFLPLSHTLERTGSYYLPMLAGSTVAYGRSIGQLAQDLQAVRPTVVIAVPRVFERVYAKLQERLAKQGALSRGLFNLAVRTGRERFEHVQGRGRRSARLLLWPLLRRLVADRVLQRLGGRVRIAVSGGAPLPTSVAQVFIGLGLPLLQGYGLTEASPVISVNRLEDNRPASVGPPLPGVEVRIADSDELQARSPGVMLGYWNNPAATAEVITPDGWLRTGDQARLEGGYIYITGRLKDILVLSNGEKVPPADMEMTIGLDPLIEQVLVVGEGRSFLSALLVLNPEAWPSIAKEYGLDPDRPESLRDRRVLGMVQQRVAAALRGFPGYAKVRRVALLTDPWTIENGLLTPTMKIKRTAVLGRYAELVDAMYRESGAN